MGQLSREQILDILARVEAELLRIRVTGQPGLLVKPLTLLNQLDAACKELLPAERYGYYHEKLGILQMALTQAIRENERKKFHEVVILTLDIIGAFYSELKEDKFLLRTARVKKEIVFCPYKAAMWDSLESIWVAAAADTEHCHTYVVPIPYADRNPDGTAKAWHNERDLFPDYVPTLDCETFDLEALHPDVIFIHNGYDNCNIVTSVDSRFYTDKLKKYTGKLVYVPYFVMKRVEPHFCQIPGVLNADYVIVDSEENKEIYEENYPGGDPPEGKFMALGSPKYDKLSAGKEAYTLPLAWEKLIAGRNIILYNTSLSAQLRYPKHIISKLQSVLAYFKQRTDLALWWRPHPLMEATFDSMIPQVAEAYRQIRDIYVSEGWGIYDDTPEMERAIACSDAYYGDPSSVGALYEKTGKPMLLQNLEVNE